MAQVFARYPGCEVVGVGRGADGALLGLRDGTLVRAGAVAPRGVVNTSGAGDALFASFLHGWLATGNPVDALRSAVLHAGLEDREPGTGRGITHRTRTSPAVAGARSQVTVETWLSADPADPRSAWRGARGPAHPPVNQG